MSKQDRQGVRTAADLERKYNLGRNAQGGSENNSTNNSTNNSDQVSKVAQELSEYKAKVNSKLQSMETSIGENAQNFQNHVDNKENPHNVTKDDVGLGNVDNTSDTEKPVSTAQQGAINTALSNANAYTDERIAGLGGGGSFDLSYDEENEAIILGVGSGVAGISEDDFNEEVTQVELDLVSALANANKAAHEANASAIQTIQAEVEELSGRVTTLEECHDGYTEASSLDIIDMFN